MRSPRHDDEELSDQHVRSAIRYLDPKRNCQNAGRPVLVPVVVFLVFWMIFLLAMYDLTVRVSRSGAAPTFFLREPIISWLQQPCGRTTKHRLGEQ